MSLSVNILFPVKNEQHRLRMGIEESIRLLQGAGLTQYTLTIVDNGSTDSTSAIAIQLADRYENVSSIRIEQSGVGVAFRAGVACNTCSIVGYMDIDLATSPSYVSEVLQLFESDPALDIVNASRWRCSESNAGRPLVRRVTSAGLVAYLKVMLGMQASDAVCGFKFFRREVAEALVEVVGANEDGWSYIVELLVRSERAGLSIAELPVTWKDDGHSGVRVVRQTLGYLIEIPRIRRRLSCTERRGR